MSTHLKLNAIRQELNESIQLSVLSLQHPCGLWPDITFYNVTETSKLADVWWASAWWIKCWWAFCPVNYLFSKLFVCTPTTSVQICTTVQTSAFPPKTECGCLHRGVTDNSRASNPLTLCSVPALVQVQVCVYIPGDPQVFSWGTLQQLQQQNKVPRGGYAEVQNCGPKLSYLGKVEGKPVDGLEVAWVVEQRAQVV